MRNTRLGTKVELYDVEGKFISHIECWRAARLVARGIAWVVKRVGELVKAIRLLPPPPQPSDSANSPATITLADVLANVGLACTFSDGPRSRGHQNYISRERVAAAQDKIAEFAIPAWIDCVVQQEAVF